MSLKEYDGTVVSASRGEAHEQNDLEMRETLVTIASILKDILVAIERKGV